SGFAAPAAAGAPLTPALAFSFARREPPITRSLERVLEVAAGDADRDLGHRAPLDRAGQDLLADAREQRVGQDGVDHAAAALELGAAADHQLDDVVVVGERDAVVLGD